jgi:hypothetical protein
MNLQLFRKNISDWVRKVLTVWRRRFIIRRENFEGVGKTS